MVSRRTLPVNDPRRSVQTLEIEIDVFVNVARLAGLLIFRAI
jgi:hypothetical protein